MSSLSDYIEKIKKFAIQNPDLSEEELIRYVYLDLGKRFAFDRNFIPFGNSKSRHEIYAKSKDIQYLNKCMDSNTIICLSSARILEYVLRNNGVNIKTIREPYNLMQSKCPHVYNLVYPKDGSEPYTMDLQEDIYNIQSHSFTKNYGLSYNDPKRLAISRLKQEEMDRKFGFINDEYYYTDDYLYLLKWDMAFFENFRDKAKFVLENIDVLELPHMEYTDKHWHHARILEELFSEDEFDYYRGNSKMRMIDCYKDINGERKYINCIAVRANEKETDIYLYNDKDSRYVQIPFDNFVKAVKNGLVIHNLKVPGLNRALRNSKNKKEKDDR